MLFIYSMANIVGNIIAGKLLVKHAVKSLIAVPLCLVAVYILLFALGALTYPVALIILLFGILAGIMVNNGQYMLTDAAPEAPDFINGLYLASGNVGLTIGTVVCGLFISGIGTRYSVFGAILFLTTGMVFVFLRQKLSRVRRNMV
jgi:predicted MFS family arabinose efflux permease